MTDEERKVKSSLVQKFGQSCWGCTVAISDSKLLVLDHIIPKNEGGSDTIENRALLCASCNSKKGNRLTLSGLREANGVKSHTIDLKAALEWTREQAATLLVTQLTFPARGLELPSEKVPKTTANLSTQSFDGNGVHGLRQLCGLVALRSYPETAEALTAVIQINTNYYHDHGTPVTDVVLRIDGDELEKFHHLDTMGPDARVAVEAAGRTVTQTAGLYGALEILLDIPEPLNGGYEGPYVGGQGPAQYGGSN